MIYFLCPTFGRIGMTRAAINSIKEKFPPDSKFVILDDKPPFLTYDLLHEKEPSVHVIKGSGDLFWGGGMNRLLHYVCKNFALCDSDKIIFFNNDICLEKINVERFFREINKFGMVHPVLINDFRVRIPAGSKIITWLPFLTINDTRVPFRDGISFVDMASARFLAFNAGLLNLIGQIDPGLPHYGGDNDFVLRAKRFGVKPVISNAATVKVSESDSGIKINNNPSLRSFFLSFWSIKSPNSLKYRFRLVSNHKNKLLAVFIVASMTVKAVAGYLFFKMLKNEAP